MTSDRRLIEEMLPIRFLSTQAASEKLIRYGHISTVHPWWARRPLVACRAAILGALTSAQASGKGPDASSQFIRDTCTWEASDNSRQIEKARQLILRDNKGIPKVLDCFAGGGAIPLEALRLGCEAYALELNPVAVLIELCTLVYPQRYGKPATKHGPQKGIGQEVAVPNRLSRDVGHWSQWVLDESRKDLSRFFPSDSDGSVPVAYLWARTVTCPNPKCGARVPLVRQLWLAKRPKRQVALRIVPDPARKRVTFDVVENKKIDFDPKQGTMRLGTVRCPCCSNSTKGQMLRKEAISGRMGQQLIAVVLTRTGETGKKYRAPTPRDVESYEEARRTLENSGDPLREVGGIPSEPLFVPKCKTFKGELGPFFVQFPTVNYGLKTFGQLFNRRQALVLATFSAKVREAHDRIFQEVGDKDYARAVATYLGLAVDKLVDYDSALCLWISSRENQSNTFTRQALPMVWDYSEINPFSGSTGDWLSATRVILRVIEHCSRASPAPAEVRQGSATQLPYPDSHFDAVVTDPPYYDNIISYAALSDFFYVWLKRTSGDLYPDLFATPLTPKSSEITEDDSHLRRAGGTECESIKDKAFFDREMSKVFRELHRVLKPEGVCVLVFAHKTTTAWETLMSALIHAGFSVSASWPLRTERATRLLAQESAALASSVWLVCRKRAPDAPPSSWKQVQTELEARVGERIDFFLSQGIRGADALLSAIGPAVEVFGKYSKVERVTGEPVTVGEFMDKVQEVVSRHALAAVLKGREIGAVDSPTAFYVLWKWSYESRDEEPLTVPQDTLPSRTEAQETVEEEEGEGRKWGIAGVKIHADDALKFAHSVGAEFDELTKPGGILRKEKEYVRLQGPAERREVKSLGEVGKNGRPPALIDILHRALNHWSAGERAALEEYLDATGALTNEALWRVAGALSRILPLESSEKRLIDGLWGKYGSGVAGAGHEMLGKAQTTLGLFTEDN